MTVQTLRERFKMEKQYEAECANELLDFARRLYLYENISIKDFRNIVKTLEQQGAVTPEYIL
ncbi:MAG: hypothetical protein C6W58_03075 [Bacillaceae bacterium]|jgi:hypothetical protein|uniref:YppF-like protein n=2 Tax=Aeribacillus TaxID=1055323 RepID=A0A161ZS46_9BACI|nr:MULTISPECIES: YppF family protein [Aeribacillus]AXI39973.1 hypothetical protein CX649_10150 [Bacillaceae bacterium ZC4]REJ20441.1 MAG: hypothetical protein C6W58_03075 [Bacillaceae bacterium]ASS91697.1 hypothetical protein AP3564_16935 [Aeribacillus pallidus]KZM52659.1 hypothetical protein A3Q35_03590 [Aeribacillus pallidus]KZN95807.1 hypothetical protein AZI98_12085 [Aeribacillus pallidus]